MSIEEAVEQTLAVGIYPWTCPVISYTTCHVAFARLKASMKVPALKVGILDINTMG